MIAVNPQYFPVSERQHSTVASSRDIWNGLNSPLCIVTLSDQYIGLESFNFARNIGSAVPKHALVCHPAMSLVHTTFCAICMGEIHACVLDG
jgi:hypothetical protein